MQKTGFVLALAVIGALFAAAPASAQMSNDALMKRGKMLWNNRGCGGCHGIGKKMAGPDLAGVEMRRSREWLNRWLKETDVMLASDSTAMAMMQEWNGIRMPKQNLTDGDIEAILAYMRAEEAKQR
jgi:mono/diheme cytochrome c family protein